MRHSPMALRRRAKEYRSIAADIRTPEVRESVLQLADLIERRADTWAELTSQAVEIERV
ncbi:MAG TPA: hypothetical protein VD768_04610 [Sphingomicrobium sp.]|nr:hypothetical protein [Sphingomicrobium sp.]